MIQQKVYLLPKNSEQLNNLNIDLQFLLIFSDRYLFQFFSRFLIVEAVLYYLELIKLQLEHKVFVQYQLSYIMSRYNAIFRPIDQDQ